MAAGNRLTSACVCLGMKAHLTLIGAALALAACAPSTPEASPTPSTKPEASATRSAAAASTSPSPDSVPVAGKCAYPSDPIPDKVMVRDVFRTGTGVTPTCVDRGAEDAYAEYLPDPCDRDLGVKTSSIVARRAIEVMFDDDPSNDDPQASLYRQTVTVYNSADAASAYLSSVRAAVRECPVRDLTSATWKYAILSSTAQRLELSIRHIANHPVEGGEPQEATFRVSVYRSGARVSVVGDVGWEGHPSTKSAVDALVKTAAEQLDRW
jgi:hypothetical protein